MTQLQTYKTLNESSLFCNTLKFNSGQLKTSMGIKIRKCPQIHLYYGINRKKTSLCVTIVILGQSYDNLNEGRNIQDK